MMVALTLVTGCERSPSSEKSASAAAPPSASVAVTAAHPLDPLTPDEIRLAVRVAKGDARFVAAAFPSIAVQEPPKGVDSRGSLARRSPGRPGCRQ